MTPPSPIMFIQRVLCFAGAFFLLMPATPLPTPRNNWEYPRALYDILVDENDAPIVLDNLQEISIGYLGYPKNEFVPITHTP